VSVGELIEVRLWAVRYGARDVNLYEFRRPDGGILPDAEPGAHIGLHLPNGLERQYSLTEAERASDRYQIAVKREPQSRGASRFIHDQLRVGSLLRISPPRNNFPLDERAALSVFIAGGIGITPIRSMVGRLHSKGAAWQLHYACRSRADAAFLDELADPAVRLHFDEEAGSVLDIAAIVASAPADTHFYCCGPAPMLRAFEALAADRPAGTVHVEYFTPKQEAARTGGYTIELARSRREFQIPAGETILNVLRAHGIDVASSCEEGVCAACETVVIAGAPDHRDSILSDAERAAGKTMMICCSGSRSDRLVLDL
jgi:ferredoxin-NADP reductase